MLWAFFYLTCATVALHLSAVVALEFIGLESSSVALAFLRYIAVAAISVLGFILSWLELLIYFAFFTVYTSSMFASMAVATGIIWVFRTATEVAYYLSGRAAKTKKID